MAANFFGDACGGSTFLEILIDTVLIKICVPVQGLEKRMSLGLPHLNQHSVRMSRF